ncbi:MAG: hypothetical protein ABI227_10240 [Rhodanobacter sp.]
MLGLSPNCSAVRAVATVVAAACSNAPTITCCFRTINAVITMVAVPTA